MGAAAGAGLLTSCGETLRSPKATSDEGQSLQRFVDALAIPKTPRGNSRAALEIVMSEFRQQLHRDLGSTVVWGYGDPEKGVVPDTMEFRVTGMTGDDSSLPAKIAQVHRLREETALHLRRFTLDMVDESPKCTELGFRWLINGLGWDDITK